jgi:predicted nucleic acid-binding protein
MQILIDTNILIRATETGHPVHRSVAVALKELRYAGNTFCVVPQILYEFWSVATRPLSENGLGLSTAEADKLLAQFGPPYFRFCRDERAIFDYWRELVIAHDVKGKKSHDARLVAAMRRHGISQLLTFNINDFKRFTDITIIDPAIFIIS